MKTEEEKSFDAKLGKTIKILRERKGITRENLWIAIGKSDSTLSKIEGGTMQLSPLDLCIVSELLGIGLDYLFAFARTGKEPMLEKERDSLIADKDYQIDKLKIALDGKDETIKAYRDELEVRKALTEKKKGK